MKKILVSAIASLAFSATAANVTWGELGLIEEDASVVTGVTIPTVVAGTPAATDLNVTVTPVVVNGTTNSYEVTVAAPAGFDPTALQEAIDDLCDSTNALQTSVTALGTGKADKATTLAGYGITDASISNGTITLGSETITPLTSFTETDPTVPSWAKAETKPSYTAAEVGAIVDTAVSGITWDNEIEGEISNLHETIVALKQLITALGGTPPAAGE